MKRLFSLLLATTLALLFVGCPAPDAGVSILGNTMVPADAAISSLFCRETSIIYKRAEFGEFLPGSLSKTAYATAALEGGGALYFYKIKDANPHEYLFQADEYDNYPTYLLYASTLSLPNLIEMEVSDILICDASADYFWRDANVIDRIRLYDRVRDIVHAYEDGEKLTELPAGATVLSCELIFVSSAYKFNAVVELRQLEDGTILLSTSRGTVAVSANLFDGYALQWQS